MSNDMINDVTTTQIVSNVTTTTPKPYDYTVPITYPAYFVQGFLIMCINLLLFGAVARYKQLRAKKARLALRLVVYSCRSTS